MKDEIKLKDHKTAYKERSMMWALCNEDFSDLTREQIAEVFDTGIGYVSCAISRIKKETGYIVKYKKLDPKGNVIEE